MSSNIERGRIFEKMKGRERERDLLERKWRMIVKEEGKVDKKKVEKEKEEDRKGKDGKEKDEKENKEEGERRNKIIKESEKKRKIGSKKWIEYWCLKKLRLGEVWVMNKFMELKLRNWGKNKYGGMSKDDDCIKKMEKSIEKEWKRKK